MDFIKVKGKVQNNKVIVDIPEDFQFSNVEVIILPVNEEEELNAKIMKVSEKSFKEWDNPDDEIYNTL